MTDSGNEFTEVSNSLKSSSDEAENNSGKSPHLNSPYGIFLKKFLIKVQTNQKWIKFWQIPSLSSDNPRKHSNQDYAEPTKRNINW